MQLAQTNCLLSIRVQLLIAVQNNDKKYLSRHNNSTTNGKCQKILNKSNLMSLGQFENDICQKFS